MKSKRLLAAMAVALVLSISPALEAKTLRLANQGDITSLDPHTLNEAFQLHTLGNVFDALTTRDKNMKVVPSLATSWRATSPTVWRFELRKDVKFHDGSPFSADDVLFSYARAAGEGSDVKSYVADVKEVRKINDFTVEIETKAPFPILPSTLDLLYIVNKKWMEENRAQVPADRRKGQENPASFKTNGTGLFMVKERQPGVKTVMVRNPNHWAKVDSNVTEVVFTPIANDATRVAALLSAQVDVMEPVPAQDVARVNASANARVMSGPELRMIFLGMDQKRDELLYSSVKGKNPFKDVRVRQAFYQAIDIEGIKNTVMRGAANPAGLLIAPQVNGFVSELNKRLPYSPSNAKKLLAEAGYANGFEITLNCPNDRYINDSEICQAVAASLAKVGVKVNLAAESKLTYFPKVLKRDTSFYMLGWIAPTVDAFAALMPLMSCPDGKGVGSYNLGSYCNPKFDELVQKVQSEGNEARRNQYIDEALTIHNRDIGHLPLHQQFLAWGVAKNIDLHQMPENSLRYKWVVIK